MYLRNVLLVTVDESHFGDQLKKPTNRALQTHFLQYVEQEHENSTEIKYDDFPPVILIIQPALFISSRFQFPASSPNIPHFLLASTLPIISLILGDLIENIERKNENGKISLSLHSDNVRSLTMTEKMGINTVPWGTPLLTLTNS